MSPYKSLFKIEEGKYVNGPSLSAPYLYVMLDGIRQKDFKTALNKLKKITKNSILKIKGVEDIFENAFVAETTVKRGDYEAFVKIKNPERKNDKKI